MEFVGDFFHLADFFHDVKRFVHVANQNVIVNGRLVTIDSVELRQRPTPLPAPPRNDQGDRVPVAEDGGRDGRRYAGGSGCHHSGHDAGGNARTGGNAYACPDRHGDPIGNVMKVFLLDLWHDLKEKRLWPVAVVLLVALVAVPVLLAKPATKSSAPAPVATAAGPKPDVLKQLAKVKLGEDEVGDGSTLGAFNPSNPFNPPKGAIKKVAGPGTATARRHRGHSRRDGRQRFRRDARRRHHHGRSAQRWQHRRWRHRRRRRTTTTTAVYKYVVDVTYKANGNTRHIKGMEKLDMLPNQSSPLLIFLGVTPKGSNAVFLVDSTLQAAGEGKCKPSEAECAFAYIGAGSQYIFTKDNGDSYTVRIDEIRKVKVGEVATGGRAGGSKAQLSGPQPALSASVVADVVVVAMKPLRFRCRYGKSIGRNGTHHHHLSDADRRGSPRGAGTAGAQKRSKAPAPQITRVQPMRVAVGGFAHDLAAVTSRRSAARTHVVFRAGDGRTAFAKPTRATKRKLVVRVPAAVSRLLKVSNSRQRPTRLRLRVLAGKFSKLTPRRLSPVVTGVGDGSGGPGGGGPGGNAAVCNDDADHDNDLLTNSLELADRHRPVPRRTPTRTRCRTAGSTTRPRT